MINHVFVLCVIFLIVSLALNAVTFYLLKKAEKINKQSFQHLRDARLWTNLTKSLIENMKKEERGF